MDQILMNAAGLAKLDAQIAEMSKKLNEEMKTHINPGSGNLHDSLDPIHDINRISFLYSVISQLEYIRSISTLISEDALVEASENAVSINDIVKITLSSPEIYEEKYIRIVFSLGIDPPIDGVDDISINCPLARAILNKQVGSLSEFQVHDKSFRVLVAEKATPELEVALS